MRIRGAVDPGRGTTTMFVGSRVAEGGENVKVGSRLKVDEDVRIGSRPRADENVKVGSRPRIDKNVRVGNRPFIRPPIHLP